MNRKRACTRQRKVVARSSERKISGAELLVCSTSEPSAWYVTSTSAGARHDYDRVHARDVLERSVGRLLHRDEPAAPEEPVGGDERDGVGIGKAHRDGVGRVAGEDRQEDRHDHSSDEEAHEPDHDRLDE